MRSHAQVRILAYASRSRSVDSFIGGVPQQLLGAAAALIAVQYSKCLYRPRNSDTPGNTLHTHVTPISHCDSNTSRTLSDCLRLTAGSLRWLAGLMLVQGSRSTGRSFLTSRPTRTSGRSMTSTCLGRPCSPHRSPTWARVRAVQYSTRLLYLDSAIVL